MRSSASGVGAKSDGMGNFITSIGHQDVNLDAFEANCMDHRRPPTQNENIPKSYKTKDGKVSSLLAGIRGNTKANKGPTKGILKTPPLSDARGPKNVGSKQRKLTSSEKPNGNFVLFSSADDWAEEEDTSPPAIKTDAFYPRQSTPAQMINRNHTRSSLKMRKGVRSDKVIEPPNAWIGNSNDKSGNSNDNRENISPISQCRPTNRSLVYDETIPCTSQQETKPRKRHFGDSGGGDNHISDKIHSTFTTKARPKAVTLEEVRDSERSQNINRPLNSNQTLAPEMVGFPNRGLTCYMNSVLQCLLAGCPDFSSEVIAAAGTVLARKEAGVGLTQTLARVADLRCGIWTEVVRENITKALDALKKELVKICPQFDGYEMQDAHEFLISLLDAIKEEQTPKNPEGNPDEIPKVEEGPAEEVQNGSSNQAAATATNLVDRSFQFEMTSTRHCNICDKRTTENLQEHIFKLSLPKATPSKEGLPQPEGIQLLLNKTMEQKSKFHCSNCAEKRQGMGLSEQEVVTTSNGSPGKTPTGSGHCETEHVIEQRFTKLPKHLLLYCPRILYEQSEDSEENDENQKENNQNASANANNNDPTTLTATPDGAKSKDGEGTAGASASKNICKIKYLKNRSPMTLALELSLHHLQVNESEVAIGEDLSGPDTSEHQPDDANKQSMPAPDQGLNVDGLAPSTPEKIGFLTTREAEGEKLEADKENQLQNILKILQHLEEHNRSLDLEEASDCTEETLLNVDGPPPTIPQNSRDLPFTKKSQALSYAGRQLASALTVNTNCKHCQMVFRVQSSLESCRSKCKAHEKVCDKRPKCSQCGLRFDSKEDMENHQVQC